MRMTELDGAAAAVRAASRVTVLTGAGISTESGIPDFRGPNGIWTTRPGAEKLSTLHHYMSDPAVRAEAWRTRLEHPAWTAQPNAGHRGLVELERAGRLHMLITQNIDGLHRRAGSSSERLIEIHGTIHEVVCMGCGERAAMQTALERVRAGEPDPHCRGCGGILKSATISFGQNLVPDELRRAQAAAATCDLFLAVGTSLTVHPAASLPRIALDAGARLIVVNAQTTPYDDAADFVIRAPIGLALPRLVGSSSAAPAHTRS